MASEHEHSIELDVLAPPNPGSDEALDAGCLCPVMDNAHGRGWMGGAVDEDGNTVFVKHEHCPLHGWNREVSTDGR